MNDSKTILYKITQLGLAVLGFWRREPAPPFALKAPVALVSAKTKMPINILPNDMEYHPGKTLI